MTKRTLVQRTEDRDGWTVVVAEVISLFLSSLVVMVLLPRVGVHDWSYWRTFVALVIVDFALSPSATGLTYRLRQLTSGERPLKDAKR